MPFQFQSQPLVQSDPGLRGLLDTLVGRLSGPGNIPQFGDTRGAFDAARNAARARSADTTRANIDAVRERAAASGKTLSSAAIGNQARAASQGANALEALLSKIGIQEQSLLGRQAESVANAQNTRDQLAQSLLTGIGSVSSGNGVPSFQQQLQLFREQRRNQLQDELRRRAFAKEDASRARVRPGGPAGAIGGARASSTSQPAPKQNPLLTRLFSLFDNPVRQPSFAQADPTGFMGFGSNFDLQRKALERQSQIDDLVSLLGGRGQRGSNQVAALGALLSANNGIASR